MRGPRQLSRLQQIVPRGTASRAALICLGVLYVMSVRADDPAAPTTPAAATGDAAADSPTNEPGQDAATAEGAPVTTEQPAPAAPTIQQPQVPAELRPYRVLVSVGFASDPAFDARFRQMTLQRLQEQVAGQLGAMWNADYEISPHLGAAGEEVLEEKSVLLSGIYGESGYDKVFWLTVSSRGGRYSVSGIEWDGTIKQPGPVLSQETRDSRRIDETLMATMLDLFRPVAIVNEVAPRKIVLTTRAGEFLPPVELGTQFRVGDYLAMSIRYLDRKRVLQRIQEVPWTYLRVDSIDRARMEMTAVSAFRQPIPEPGRRIEIAGLLLKVVHDETVLTLNARGTPPEPLIASPVDVMDRYPTMEDAVEDRIRLVSDRLGSVAIPAFPDSPMRYLMIHSGDQVLAKVPIIPGVTERLQLEVPNDAPRLAVEGELFLLQGQLIDLVARGAVLMARATSSAKAGRWEEVDGFTTELDQLPILEDVLEEIDGYEAQGSFEAQALNDNVQQARIRRMCQDLSDLATRHLAPERRTKFDEEIRDLRAASGAATTMN